MTASVSARPTAGASREIAAAALLRATAVIADLSPAQLEDLAEGRARLEFRPVAPAAPARRRAVSAPPAEGDVSGAVQEINRLTRPAEVADYLERSRFTVAVLKEIARALGPTVPATGRNRADLTHNIVEGTAGFRERSAAMSGGAWS